MSIDEIKVQLSEKIKKIVKDEVSQFQEAYKDQQKMLEESGPIAAIPLKYCLPESSDQTIETGKILYRKTMIATEIVTSFQLSSECSRILKSIDDISANDFGSKISERLKGWKIELSLRYKGGSDLFYCHEKFGEHFRSIVEVVEYIIYERRPKKRPKKRKERAYDHTEGSRMGSSGEASHVDGQNQEDNEKEEWNTIV
ncbi:hypothetical protein ACFE04_003062 [Oxalis oulophora]